MNDLAQKQYDFIEKIFAYSKEHGKPLFLKGGWNIDLVYGQVTRDHEDIDLMFDTSDHPFWRDWYAKQGFTEQPQGEFYSIYESPEGFHVDMGGFSFDPKAQVITWSHGGTAKLTEVAELQIYKDFSYLGMKMGVERYLKLKHADYGKRERDKKDVEILNKILNTVEDPAKNLSPSSLV
ncbi:MAG: hypothetical protein ACD_22C00047G0017 [uncultured bacterium]|nr:MAG: hypothetical protein ACD_22C00047G0017 [uncultured bacterium]